MMKYLLKMFDSTHATGNYCLTYHIPSNSSCMLIMIVCIKLNSFRLTSWLLMSQYGRSPYDITSHMTMP